MATWPQRHPVFVCVEVQLSMMRQAGRTEQVPPSWVTLYAVEEISRYME